MSAYRRSAAREPGHLGQAALAGRLFGRTLRLEVLPASEYVLDTK